MRYRRFLAMFSGAPCPPLAPAAQPVRIDDAWVRATMVRQRATGAFMRLWASAPARLLEAASPAAARVALHETRMVGDAVRMREVEGLDLAAGKTVHLEPHGYHIVLLGLRERARAGERIPLSLTFEDAGGRRFCVEVSAAVRGPRAEPGACT